MALAEAVQGARYVAQQITWSDSDGNAVDLIGATLTGYISDRNGASIRAIDGTLAIVTAASGIFTWAYGVVDVGTVGVFQVQFIATYGSGLKDKTILANWRVNEAIDE
jgi:hypothetical protein